MNTGIIEQNKSINRELVELTESKYKTEFNDILITKQETSYVKIKKQVLVKSNTPGKFRNKTETVPVTKTVVDEYNTRRTKKNYILSMNPQKKEEILAAIGFLSSFMPSGDDSLNPFFNEAVIRYNSLITKAQQVYSSDQTFIAEMEAMKVPFDNAKRIVETWANSAQKQKPFLWIKRFGAYAFATLTIVFILFLLVGPWLVYFEFELESVIAPIIMDVVTVGLILFVSIRFYLWDFIFGYISDSRESYAKNRKLYENYVRLAELLQPKQTEVSVSYPTPPPASLTNNEITSPPDSNKTSAQSIPVTTEAPKTITVLKQCDYKSKGRLCHAVVKTYVDQHPDVALTQLKQVFNIPKCDVVIPLNEALAIKDSAGKVGGDYYIKDVDQIKLDDGIVVVWSYWPERYFLPFLENVKKTGFIIE